jgi:hypothetical protein
MSQHNFKSVTKDDQKVEVLMGYDRPLNYVFCVVTAESGAFVYSNLSDPKAGIHCQDVEYYRTILDMLGIQAPESVIEAVKEDQKRRGGNRIVQH